MPSKTPKQKKLMGAVANNPAFAKKVGIPQKVGKEFAKADAVKGNIEKPKLKFNKPAPMLGSYKGIN